MSTDFIIDTQKLLLVGATIELTFVSFGDDQYYEYLLQLPEYAYKRSCDLNASKTEVLLSCSGTFRVYLTNWLKQNNINYTEH